MKRSITLSGHRTSISVEEEFWAALKDIAKAMGTTPSRLVSDIDAERAPETNLSSEIRLYVLRHYRSLAAQKDIN